MLYGPQARYFKDEITPQLKHTSVGVVAMSNLVKDQNDSRFYITLAANLDYLDGKHTIFGQVAEGIDVSACTTCLFAGGFLFDARRRAGRAKAHMKVCKQTYLLHTPVISFASGSREDQHGVLRRRRTAVPEHSHQTHLRAGRSLPGPVWPLYVVGDNLVPLSYECCSFVSRRVSVLSNLCKSLPLTSFGVRCVLFGGGGLRSGSGQEPRSAFRQVGSGPPA